MPFHGGMGYAEELWVARACRAQRLLRIGVSTSRGHEYMAAKLLQF